MATQDKDANLDPDERRRLAAIKRAAAAKATSPDPHAVLNSFVDLSTKVAEDYQPSKAWLNQDLSRK